MIGDWADTIADEMMARANGRPEQLEALRHELAAALRDERLRCKSLALSEAKPDWGDEAVSHHWRDAFEICSYRIASKIEGILK